MHTPFTVTWCVAFLQALLRDTYGNAVRVQGVTARISRAITLPRARVVTVYLSICRLFRRTFKTKTIVFFDTKVLAHRMNIVLGLAGIKSAELHGNLAMTQRLEALDRRAAIDPSL